MRSKAIVSALGAALMLLTVHPVGAQVPTGFREATAGAVLSARLPTTQPRVLWKFSAGSAGSDIAATTTISDAVCSEGVVYFGDSTGNLFAYLAETGERLWKRNLGSRLGKPSVDPSRVFVTNQAGVTAIDRETGKFLWIHEIANGAGESSPIAVADALFVSGYDGFARELNVETGEEVWRCNLVSDFKPVAGRADDKRGRFGNIVARPRGATCDGKLFIQAVFDQSRIVAIDCDSGARQWTFQANHWTADGPIIADGRVYIGSQDHWLYCLDVRNGELQWKFKTPTWLASKPALHRGFVYQPSHRGELFKLDARTGEQVWKFQPVEASERESHVYSFPIVTEDTAYFAAGTGCVFAVNTETGELRWKLRPSANSEIYSNLATDGERMFLTTRTKEVGIGENSVIAIGQ